MALRDMVLSEGVRDDMKVKEFMIACAYPHVVGAMLDEITRYVEGEQVIQTSVDD